MISAIMGRYYSSSKQEADYLKKLSVWWLKRNGYLEAGWWKSGGIKWTNDWTDKESSINFYVSLFENDQYINFIYTQTDYETEEKTKYDYKIPLTSTPCYFGGKRYWFLCNWYSNGVYCGRRVGVLYLGGKYFACRHCYDLSYASRNENRRFNEYPLFHVIENRSRMDKLRESIKRNFYKGKPTRKLRALNRLAEREFPYDLAFMDIYKKNQMKQKGN